MSPLLHGINRSQRGEEGLERGRELSGARLALGMCRRESLKMVLMTCRQDEHEIRAAGRGDVAELGAESSPHPRSPLGGHQRQRILVAVVFLMHLNSLFAVLGPVLPLSPADLSPH